MHSDVSLQKLMFVAKDLLLSVDDGVVHHFLQECCY